MSDRPLPAAVRRDLDRAAAGIGRTPTTAHPDCTCVQPVERQGHDGAPITVHLVTPAGFRRCPQHGPEVGR